MKHFDALTRNPSASETPAEKVIFAITQADWVLSGQLTDEKIKNINIDHLGSYPNGRKENS